MLAESLQRSPRELALSASQRQLAAASLEGRAVEAEGRQRIPRLGGLDHLDLLLGDDGVVALQQQGPRTVGARQRRPSPRW
jgi:hypothetical protein